MAERKREWQKEREVKNKRCGICSNTCEQPAKCSTFHDGSRGNRRRGKSDLIRGGAKRTSLFSTPRIRLLSPLNRTSLVNVGIIADNEHENRRERASAGLLSLPRFAAIPRTCTTAVASIIVRGRDTFGAVTKKLPALFFFFFLVFVHFTRRFHTPPHETTLSIPGGDLVPRSPLGKSFRTRGSD